MDLTFQYLKKRNTFGRQPMFCEQGPDMCVSIPVEPIEHSNYILRNPVHQQVQNTPCFSQNTINTIRAEYTSSGMNHAEGGWPKDVHCTDIESTQRYRRRVEKDDPYIHCVMTLADDMEHYILQNNAIELYRTYYSEMRQLPEVEHTSVRTMNVYRDTYKRAISSIHWEPSNSPRFVVSYADLNFFHKAVGETTCYVWDAQDATQPALSLETPEDCAALDIKFSRNGATLVGGLSNGQVAVWDARTGGLPTALCAMHVAHRNLVRSVVFINTKSGCEFFSGGPDGAVKWWDYRNMSEPTDQMIMDHVNYSFDVQMMERAYGVSVLEYESTLPTRFMAGTENGSVMCANRKGKTALEQIPNKLDAHLGPIWSLERNPGFLKNFLTVGDWTAKIWSEDCRESAIWWTPLMRQKVTAGVWSMTRMSLLLLITADGKLAIWDILRKQHEPVLTVQVSSNPLVKLQNHEQGTLTAIGNNVGQTYLVEFSDSLAQSDARDKPLLTAIFERESLRERILEARLREIRLKMRQAEEGSVVGSVGDDPTVGDKDLAEATADFFAVVRKEMSVMT